jgi:hypothetical protein
MPAQARNKYVPIVFVAAGVLLIFGATLWVLLQSPTKVILPSSTAPIALPLTSQAALPNSDIQRISLGDARAAYELGNAVFVDVRDAQSYADSHIKKSINIPSSEIEARLAELDQNAWIITYCT